MRELKMAGVFVVVLVTSCNNHDDEKAMAENRERAERCREALSHRDPWSATPLPEGCKPAEPPPAPCEPRGEQGRIGWIDKTLFVESGMNVTPGKAGFRAEGRCHTELVSRGLTCELKEVADVHGEDPFTNSALEIGFNTLVCERISDGKHFPFPLERYRSSKAK